MPQVGLVTTIPVEVLFAAGVVPVDLNNVFITEPDPAKMVAQAELDGFPRNICSWVKGIYVAALERDIRTVVAVMRGDCSNNEAMAEVLKLKGVEIVPFSFPYPKDRRMLKAEIERLMDFFGIGWDEVNAMQLELNRVRAMVHRLDDLTWQAGSVSGLENHLWNVTSSDFNGDYRLFERQLAALLAEREREKRTLTLTLSPRSGRGQALEGRGDNSELEGRGDKLRFGFVGVPPIFADLYDYLESLGVAVVFNEVQRQFSLPGESGRDLVQQYLDYTYPYDFYDRLADIQTEIARRRIDAVIHYVQSFCHHQIQDIILRQHLQLPVLTLEGDRPGPLDARSKMRLEAFVDLCRQKTLERRSAS